jgi:Flp pilus assembly CpaE family ATPase
MKNNLSVLLVEDDAGDAATLREMLIESTVTKFQIRWADNLVRAIERLSEGRFDAILLDLSLPDCRGLETFARVQESAPGTPIIILSAEEDERLALRAVRLGAEDCLVKGQLQEEALARSIRYTVERHARKRADGAHSSRREIRGRVLTFWGAKGGVGTTTVAANTAASLAAAGKRTIVAELRSYHGTLAGCLGAASIHGDISSLLRADPDTITSDKLKSRLTRYSGNLAFLAAPQRLEECQPISPASARAIIQGLAAGADFVVLDLPPEPSEAVREAIRLSNFVGLVLDREATCVASAKASAGYLRKWGLAVPAGLVVVHRSPLALPVEVKTMKSETGLEISELIPPAADACVAASREGIPLVEAYDDSLIGASLKALAVNLAADPIVVRKRA